LSKFKKNETERNKNKEEVNLQKEEDDGIKIELIKEVRVEKKEEEIKKVEKEEKKVEEKKIEEKKIEEKSELENLTPYSTSRKKPKDLETFDLNKLFNYYVTISHEDDEEDADEDLKNCITGEGLLTFSDDLKVNPLDEILLFIFWKLEAKRQYVLTSEEFNNFQKNGCKNMKEIKGKIGSWRKDLKDNAIFKEFYRFVFDYSRENKKVLDLEFALPTWELLFQERYPLIEKWCQFVKSFHKKPITKDVWLQFFDFINDVGVNLHQYEDDGAWPVLIDEYVQFLKK
jgi:DCN1-like protein 1/2